jgi:hypothetical protein
VTSFYEMDSNGQVFDEQPELSNEEEPVDQQSHNDGLVSEFIAQTRKQIDFSTFVESSEFFSFLTRRLSLYVF